jgi:hypothetical protein
MLSKFLKFSYFIIILEIIYCLYIFLFVPWIKIRYKIFNVVGNVVFVVVLGCMLGQIISEINCDSVKLTMYYSVYIVFIIILCSLFILSNVIEIVITRNQIIRQFRSFKNRFITCVKLNEQLEMTKYDENGVH